MEKPRIKYVKEMFLSQLNVTEDTLRNYKIVFGKVTGYEKENYKDLCDFTKAEACDMYKRLKVAAPTLVTINNVLARYTAWCMANGYAHVDTNAYKEISNAELKTFEFKQIITETELKEYVDRQLCYQDKFLLASAYYGFSVEDKCSDYIYLQKKDINGTEIRLYNRTITVPDWVSDLALKAFDETAYDRNGFAVLLEGDHVIKTQRGSTDFGKETAILIISQRFHRGISTRAKTKLTHSIVHESGLLKKIRLESQKLELYDMKDLLQNETFRRDTITTYNIKKPDSSIISHYNRFI